MKRLAVIAAISAALSGVAARAADPGRELQFELADGTVITGRIDAKTITIRIATGNVLKIPVADMKELTVGLCDSPVFVRRVETLIKALDSVKTRREAQWKLIAIGLSAESVLKRHLASDVPARRLAVGQVLKIYMDWRRTNAPPGVSEAMARSVEPRSKIQVGKNTFIGTINVDEFRIASLYGTLTVKLGDVHLVRPSGGVTAASKRVGLWNVKFCDETYLRGIPINQPLRIQTRHGTLIVPLAQMQKAVFTAAGKSVHMLCGGSDRIIGTLDPKTTMSFKTDKGVVDLSVGRIAGVDYGPITLTGHTGLVLCVAISPDGKRLASGSADKTIKLWDMTTGKDLRTLKGHSEWVSHVAFSPDGKHLASGSADKTIKLWDTDTGKELRTLKGHSERVSHVAFSPDGKSLVSGSLDKTIKLWDTDTGKELRTLRGHSSWVCSVVFSPDGRRLASGGLDGTLRFWDAITGKELLTLKPHAFGVFSVIFSPDGKRLALGCHDKTVRLWDAMTGKELIKLMGHSGPVCSVAFSPDGKRLVSGGHDKTVKMWDVSDWTKEQE